LFKKQKNIPLPGNLIKTGQQIIYSRTSILTEC